MTVYNNITYDLKIIITSAIRIDDGIGKLEDTRTKYMLPAYMQAKFLQLTITKFFIMRTTFFLVVQIHDTNRFLHYEHHSTFVIFETFQSFSEKISKPFFSTMEDFKSCVIHLQFSFFFARAVVWATHLMRKKVLDIHSKKNLK